MENGSLPGTLLKDLTITGKIYEPGSVFSYSVYLAPSVRKAEPGTPAF